jgi:hypothetical protein
VSIQPCGTCGRSLDADCFPAVSRFPLRHVEGDWLHSCLPARIAQIFPKDNEFGADDGLWCESEGELLVDNEDDEDEVSRTVMALHRGLSLYSHRVTSLFRIASMQPAGEGLLLQRSVDTLLSIFNLSESDLAYAASPICAPIPQSSGIAPTVHPT